MTTFRVTTQDRQRAGHPPLEYPDEAAAERAAARLAKEGHRAVIYAVDHQEEA